MIRQMNAVVFCSWASCFVVKRMVVTVLASQAAAILGPLRHALWICLLGKTRTFIEFQLVAKSMMDSFFVLFCFNVSQYWRFTHLFQWNEQPSVVLFQILILLYLIFLEIVYGFSAVIFIQSSNIWNIKIFNL